MIHFYTTGQIKFPCVAKFNKMPFWHQNKSNRKQKFEWLFVSSFQFVIFGSVKNQVYRTLINKKMDDAGNR